jgi:hypothetical protein
MKIKGLYSFSSSHIRAFEKLKKMLIYVKMLGCCRALKGEGIL